MIVVVNNNINWNSKKSNHWLGISLAGNLSRVIECHESCPAEGQASSLKKPLSILAWGHLQKLCLLDAPILLGTASRAQTVQ